MADSETVAMSNHKYLARYAYPRTFFSEILPDNTDIIVVIPCYDEPDLTTTLKSLRACTIPNGSRVSIFVLINHSDDAPQDLIERNHRTFTEATSWSEHHSTEDLSFIISIAELPRKHAGVGLARKIGMDDAVRAFDKLSRQGGVIVCLDADCQVETNYFMSIKEHFARQSVKSASIYFEHDIEAASGLQREGIIRYETFLRYYVNALRYSGYPFAVQTVGSCMVVRADTYQKVGGMNRRKAGEDFYFIHKLLGQGGFIEILSTKVIPSGRVSHRVPFGTGAAIGKWLNNNPDLDYLYNPAIFEDIKTLLYSVNQWKNKKQLTNQDFADLPKTMSKYLFDLELDETIRRAREVTKTPLSFTKRFLQEFDGLQILKYVHYAQETAYPKATMDQGLKWLFDSYLNIAAPPKISDSLKALRRHDKVNAAQIGL